MSKYLSPKLETVTPYTPGEQPQDQQYIKLNTNESPYLPSPAVVAAVSEHEVEKLRLYSDPACTDLLKTAAVHFGLQPDQIMPGNGSDENLFFALRAFCDETHPLAYADITYGCYSVWCGLMHIPSHIIPLKEDFTLDPADYYGLNETIVIANPNAPTGLALPRSAIEGILKANPDNVVIVDEAYVDFGGESCVPLIDRYDNLLVVQTFSKSRQLAGARLGLAMGSASLIADLNRVKFSLNPYNINRLTLKAGQAALEDAVYFEKTRAAIVDTRAWTKQQLEARGFAVLDSHSNFLFASTQKKNGGELYRKLKEKGVLVRHFDAPRIENWLRITIGTPEDLALEGHLSGFFARKGIVFDMETGLFRVENQYSSQVRLVGHGQKYAMVRKALQRNGILANRNVESSVWVETGDLTTSGFRICREGENVIEVGTIEELLEQLKMENGK